MEISVYWSIFCYGKLKWLSMINKNKYINQCHGMKRWGGDKSDLCWPGPLGFPRNRWPSLKITALSCSRMTCESKWQLCAERFIWTSGTDSWRIQMTYNASISMAITNLSRYVLLLWFLLLSHLRVMLKQKTNKKETIKDLIWSKLSWYVLNDIWLIFISLNNHHKKLFFPHAMMSFLVSGKF